MEVSKPAGTIKPICPYFHNCGGCDSQDVPYKEQVQYKEAWLKLLWKNRVSEEYWEPFLATDESYPVFFRNKIRFGFIRHDGSVYPSRHQKGSAETDIPVEECFLESETANRIIRYTAAFADAHNWSLYDSKTKIGWLKHLLIREGKQTGEILLSTVTDMGIIPDQEAWVEGITKQFPMLKSLYHSESWGKNNRTFNDTHLFGDRGIHERVGKYTFFISPHAFFQTNGSMIQTLYDQITVKIAHQQPTTLWDLYAGSATIGIYASDLVKHVVSIENNPANIQDARENIRLNNVGNVEMIGGTVEDVLTSKFIAEHAHPEVIIVDPPRAGLSPKLRNLLPNLPSHHLIYVSCNPVTCLRDCQELCRHTYAITRIQGIDMFPHSWHCEMIVELEK